MTASLAPSLDTSSASQVSTRLWICAAAGAVVLHLVLAAFAFAHLQSDLGDEELGAQAIEIGLELAAPRAEPTELPPGPDVEASVATPSVVEQKTVVEETNLPKDTPVEQDEPMRVVALQDTKKPKEETPQTPAVSTAPSVESAAAKATAQPTMQLQQEAARSMAPNLGLAESVQRLRATWQKQLISHFDRHKRYPNNQTQKRIEIMVSFVLDRTGHVLTTTLASSSGDPAFDEAALAMVRRSDPVPAPPPVIADEGLSFTVPVVFRAGARN
jgi:TonB family protein